MNLEHFIVDALRAAILLGLALGAVALLRKGSPAARRLVLATALTGALVMPVVSALMPARLVPPPVAAATTSIRHVAEALVPATRPAEPSAEVAEGAGATAPVAGSSWHLDVKLWIVLAWVAGVARVLARLVAGHVRSSLLVRRARPAKTWAAAIQRAERATGLRADVRISDGIGAPAVTGVLRPVVLLPPVAETWDEARRHGVLLHELAHVRQRDCLAQLVAQLACAVHWFDPLVWIAARRLRFERELAADDAVIHAGTRASGYAEDLLAIASAQWADAEVPAGALGMGERSNLGARIAAIVSAERTGRVLGRGRATLLVAGGAVPVLALACTAPTSGNPATVATAPVTKAESVTTGAGTTVRPELQQIADEELDRAMAQWHGEDGVVLVMEPSTGEILADAGRSHGAAVDFAVQRALATGSTMKALTLAAALDEGAVRADDRFDCENGAWTYDGKKLEDYRAFGVLGIPQMMAVSTNVGFAKVADKLGGSHLDRWFRTFHFGSAPEIAGATAGTIPPGIQDHTFRALVAAIGEAVEASPVQVAALYATLANGGEYVAPTRTHRATPATRERLVKAETARTVISALESVVYDDHATGTAARVDGVRVAGKTGTAEWDMPGGGVGSYASFVGIVPATAPKYVILVGMTQPKGNGEGDSPGGGVVAAPAFARVASRILGVTK